MSKWIACAVLCAAVLYGCTTNDASGHPPDKVDVGPRNSLTAASGGSLEPGDYVDTQFTTSVSFSGDTGAYTFTDCEFTAGFDAVFGGSAVTRTVALDHCTVDAGVYFENGGQKGWTITWCYITGGTQGLRPKGVISQYDFSTPTPFVVTDSIVEITELGTPAGHCEAMQCLGGNAMEFTRVRFITPGPYQDGITGQTASINHGGNDCTFAACDFMTADAFYYTIYSDGSNVLFKNCRIASGLAGYVYPDSATMATFEGCTDLDTDASILE
jgi:hypothetical protein